MGRATGALPATVHGIRQLSGLYTRDAASVASLPKLRFFPQAVLGGKGAKLCADDGRVLIDLSAAWGAASLGYGHPALVAAVSAAVADPAGYRSCLRQMPQRPSWPKG